MFRNIAGDLIRKTVFSLKNPLKLPKRKLSLQKVTDRDHHHRSKDIAQRSIPGKGVHHEFDEDPVDGGGN